LSAWIRRSVSSIPTSHASGTLQGTVEGSPATFVMQYWLTHAMQLVSQSEVVGLLGANVLGSCVGSPLERDVGTLLTDGGLELALGTAVDDTREGTTESSASGMLLGQTLGFSLGMVGVADASVLGKPLGPLRGPSLAKNVGIIDGKALGFDEGVDVGLLLGRVLGEALGGVLGMLLGPVDGSRLGITEGSVLGAWLG